MGSERPLEMERHDVSFVLYKVIEDKIGAEIDLVWRVCNLFEHDSFHENNGAEQPLFLAQVIMKFPSDDAS